MIDTKKKSLIIYRAILNNEIAFANEMIELGHLKFLEIKEDCRRYEIKRDNRKSEQVYAVAFKHANIYNHKTTMNFNYFENSLKASCFKDYSNLMKHVARSILQYNNDNFIDYLIYNSISYSDIEQFLNVINYIKNSINSSNASNLALLNENTDLINIFFNFSAKCQQYFGYGDFKTITNKIEQLYMFENKELRYTLEKQDSHQKKIRY